MCPACNRSNPLRRGTSYLAPDESLAAVDWIVVCVRGEQLDAAFRDIVARDARDGPGASVAVAAISLDSVVERARNAGLRGTVLAYHVSFGAFRDRQASQCVTWFPFVIASTITPEAERAWLPAARTLARCIDHSGLPTRAALSMRTPMLALVALNSVLALGWSLCGWDLRRLVHDSQLRTQTAAALREALHICALRSWALGRLAALLPVGVFGLALRALARFMGPAGRRTWLHHGPKIHAQTDYIVRDLVARAAAAALPVAALTRLFARWQAAQSVPAGELVAQGKPLPVA